MWLSWLVCAALAQEPEKPAEEPVKPRKEWAFAGLPIANVSTDTGVGYGAYGSVVHKAEVGSEDPYKARVSVQLFFTTKQYQDHNVAFDFPSVFGTKYRWNLLLGYERWKQAPWYGVGNLTPRVHAEDLVDLTEEQQKSYYQYDVSWVRMNTNLRRNIKGPYDVFANALFRYATMNRVYTGSLLEAEQPLGIDGGFFGRIGIGVMYDTRDQEPSPTTGTWAEASLRVSSLVGESASVGLNVTDRRWLSLAGGDRLVFANRFIVDARRGQDPLFAYALLGGSQFVEVGGGNNLRGLGNSRFRGDVVLLWTPELRVRYFTVGSFSIFGVPFVDMGRLFLWPDNAAINAGDAVPDPRLTHLHLTGGLGHRFQVGNVMLVRLDVGVGIEEYGTFDEPDAITREPNFGFYLTFDHPF